MRVLERDRVMPWLWSVRLVTGSRQYAERAGKQLKLFQDPAGDPHKLERVPTVQIDAHLIAVLLDVIEKLRLLVEITRQSVQQPPHRSESIGRAENMYLEFADLRLSCGTDDRRHASARAGQLVLLLVPPGLVAQSGFAH